MNGKVSIGSTLIHECFIAFFVFLLQIFTSSQSGSWKEAVSVAPLTNGIQMH